MKKLLITVSLVPLYVLLLVSSPLYASAATGLSIQPVKIDETIVPGDTLESTIILTNASDGPVDVEWSLQDFLPNVGAESIKFVGRAEGVTSVQDWITVEKEKKFTLRVGEEIHVPYKITPPSDAEPGGHFGVVLFKATPVASTTGSLKVGTQVGMLVLVTIPGNHLQKGKILDFSAPAFLMQGPVPFTIRFENTGTVHFEPKGEIVIKNLFGSMVGKVPIAGSIVLPTSIKDIGIVWNTSAFHLGRYSAAATINDGEGLELTVSEVTFWIVPVWYILGFLVACVLLYMLIRFIKRHVRISIAK